MPFDRQLFRKQVKKLYRNIERQTELTRSLLELSNQINEEDGLSEEDWKEINEAKRNLRTLYEASQQILQNKPAKKKPIRRVIRTF